MTDDPIYIVTCKGLTLTPIQKGQKERDLATGDPIKRSELLTYTKAMYIDAMLKAGDLTLQQEDH